MVCTTVLTVTASNVPLVAKHASTGTPAQTVIADFISLLVVVSNVILAVLSALALLSVWFADKATIWTDSVGIVLNAIRAAQSAHPTAPRPAHFASKVII